MRTRSDQAANTAERLSPHPIELKLRLKGHANPGYQGGSKLWATCQGKIIAQLEAYVPRGITFSLIDDRNLMLDRIGGC
jgi:hypothetical protein